MKSQQRAVTSHRARQKRRGIARVEIQIRREDANLMREIARALRDPAEAPKARAILRANFAASSKNFKEFLASAPLEGIDLTRPRDFGRDIEL